MSGWTLVAFVAGVLGLIVGVPPMLGWSNERLAFSAGLVAVVGAIAWLFIPPPKPHPNVDCGTVAQPKSDWTGDTIAFGRVGGMELTTTPDFHRQCAANRSSAIQQAVVVGLVGVGVMIVYGSRARKKVHRAQGSN